MQMQRQDLCWAQEHPFEQCIRHAMLIRDILSDAKSALRAKVQYLHGVDETPDDAQGTPADAKGNVSFAGRLNEMHDILQAQAKTLAELVAQI